MTRTTDTSVTRPAPRLRSQSRLRGRSGVTLIELLVVIAIIGILLALTTAALQKTVEGQKRRATTDQVFKLQQALDMEYERVVAKCAQDATNGQIPPEVIRTCDGDMGRAKAVWTAIQLRFQFPDSFAEANMTAMILDGSGQPIFQIKRGPTFADVAGLPSDPTRLNEESGALLYLILAKRSVSGGGAMATAADDLTQAMQTKVTFGGKELNTFADAWKNSVGFKRWEQIDEVQEAPFVDPAKAKSRAPNANRDPLDPQNLVFGWAIGTSDPRYLLKSGVVGSGPTAINTGLYFNGQNRMASVYSLGQTKINQSTGLSTPEDDILGFRLRKPGERGNKQ